LAGVPDVSPGPAAALDEQGGASEGREAPGAARSAGGAGVSGEVMVATSGTIDRDDRCVGCGEPMLYAVDEHERVHDTFCGNHECHLFLVEIKA